jgi:hypothetical protein
MNNGPRRGVVLEEPLYLGEHQNAVLLDIEAEMKLAFDDSTRQLKRPAASFHKEMRDLGTQRYMCISFYKKSMICLVSK